MTPIVVSDRLIRFARTQIKRQTGEEVEEKRLKAFILLNQLKQAINKHPSTKLWRMFRQYVWHLISGRGMEDYLSFLFWLDLSTSIKNAQRWVIHQPEQPTWDHLVEEIKKYTLKDQLPLVEEYLQEVEKVLKSN